MKKFMFLGTLMAVMLAFSFTAVANEVECDTCKNFSLVNITCAGEQSECYDAMPDWQDIVFPVCDCEDADNEFLAGNQIGVRMTILTEAVYWGDENPAIGNAPYFTGYDELTLVARNDDECNCVLDPQGDPCPQYGAFCILYYDENENIVQPGNHSCQVPNSEKAKIAGCDRADAGSSFVTIPEVNGGIGVQPWDGFSFWSIEMPPLRLDYDEVLAGDLQGETVRVKIELVKPGQGGICQGPCQVICECIVEVAYICGPPTATSDCIYFPYVFTQNLPWVTGIAITNLCPDSVPPADMEATFTLTDQTGAAVTYTKDDFTTTVWNGILDLMLTEFSGTPAAGPAWLKIHTNFAVDGYQFVTDSNFGGSSLPRQSCPSCSYSNSVD